VLPHRIHWIAYPRVPQSTRVKVEFLIDTQKVLWAERDVPYRFAEDDGYLVTSWLTAGKHKFTVRATIVRRADTILKDGPMAEHTVVARVPAAPKPPAALAGTWQRTPDTTGTTFPAGTYKLVFENRWIRDRFPGKFDPKISHNTGPGTGKGLIQDNDWEPGPDTFHVQGAVIFKRFDRTDPEGGSYCTYGGPRADYSWSVDGNTLTLTPVGGKDRCSWVRLDRDVDPRRVKRGYEPSARVLAFSRLKL
jgi:hypothetical protein